MPDTHAQTPVAINIEELRRRARACLEKLKLSQAKAAKQMDCSASTLSQWLNGEYQGDVNAIAALVAKWLQKHDDGEKLGAIMPAVPMWIETPTGKRVIDALTYAQMAQDVAVIVGGAGLGKTSAIKRYVGMSTNVWTITATPATAAAGVLLEEIALALGLRDFALYPARLQRLIIQKLTDTLGCLIIDEAQHLSKGAFEAARSLHDRTNIGLVFSGNQAIYSRLYGGGSNGFAQLYSRVGKKLVLTKPMPGDVRAIAEPFRVETAPELKLLEEIGRKPGALRMVVKTLRLASIYAKGGAIVTDHIRTAWDELQGDPVEEAA